jgi:hypothetical protein
MKDHTYIEGCKDKCGCCNLCCLAICDVCGLFEGVLTTHCPERGVTGDESDLIYAGKLNFRGGLWLKESSEHAPAFYREHHHEFMEQYKSDPKPLK